jgi:hypothetical protein
MAGVVLLFAVTVSIIGALFQKLLNPHSHKAQDPPRSSATHRTH